MKRVASLVVFAATFAVAANAQHFGSTTCGLIPGPCMERMARQAYAPVDYMLNNYGYGYGGYGFYPDYGWGSGRIGTSAIVGGVAGAITGGLVAYATTRGNRTTYVTAEPGGGQTSYVSAPQRHEVVFAASKPQKALDCRKPSGKRGKNEAACMAAEAETSERQQAAERQACLDNLAASSWRLRNFSPIATIYPTVDNQPMFVCGKQVVLGPLQTNKILPPEGQVGGYFFFAHHSGEKMRAEAVVQNVNKPGFTGFVLAVPAPERGN